MRTQSPVERSQAGPTRESPALDPGISPSQQPAAASASPNNRDLLPLVAIVGPTAVGKTALSVRLAEAIGGEIVSADSRQVYRGMDIGTAKATPEERARVPHHLIDVVDPHEGLSLAQFQEMAYAAIAGILARGAIPLLVGGTGQYVMAVIEGWQIPRVPPDEALRRIYGGNADRLLGFKPGE